MTPAQQAAHDAAMAAAARALKRACTFAELHATAKPMFQGTMKSPRSAPELVRLVWPGVLLVCDPKTGEVVAESEPGKPHQLKAGFMPASLRALLEKS